MKATSGRWVRYGKDAARALRTEISSVKADEPLTPVTVVVASNQVGVSTRRVLASGAVGTVSGSGPGLIGVTFLTPYRLGELLGAAPLAAQGRRPVSTPVLGAGVRQALRTNAGSFGPVADHPATETALVAAYRELRDLSDPALDAVASAGTRAAEVVRIHRVTRSFLAQRWYDEEDLLAAATAVVQAGRVPSDIGTVVVYLPQRLSRHGAHLLEAVGSHQPLTVLAGTTGSARADAEVERSVARLGIAAPTRPPEGPLTGLVSPTRTRILTASDADDEVRAAVRRVIEAVQDGTSLDRIAVLYAAAQPYARLVHEQLAAADIPANGSATLPVAGRAAGRTVLGLLALPAAGWRRHDLFAWLGGAPILVDGRPAPVTSWERVSRDAGVVAGPTDWDRQLLHLAESLEERAADRRTHLLASGDTEDWRVDRDEADAARARSLRAFVGELIAELDRASAPAPWSKRAHWAKQLVTELLGGSAHRRHWPDAERRATERLELALDRLAVLDDVEGSVDLDVFVRSLALELEGDLGRIGRFGEGVLVGPASMGVGLDLDLVITVGMAEGTFPSTVADDSLLPDDDRARAAGALPLRSGQVDRLHHQFLATIAGADRQLLCAPRGDLRRSRERVPSRWVLDVASELAGETWWTSDLLGGDQPWLTHIASFDAGIRTETPATATEHRLRHLLGADEQDHRRLPSVAAQVDPDGPLAGGYETVVARAGHDVTRFDGNLTGLAIPPIGQRGTSATSLEMWAKCPHGYFVHHVLGARPLDQPEDALQITPIDRGTLFHDALEQFISEAIEAQRVPSPGEAWSAAHHERLAQIGAARCDEAQAQGRSGRDLFWQRDRAKILAELDRFLIEDDRHRAATGATPVAAELAFGGRARPVDVPLGDGRTVPLRGKADRIDTATDGTLWVLDYKTGSTRAYQGLSVADPHQGGRRLQLAVYGLAARQAQGTPDAPVQAAYWFTSTKGGYEKLGYQITDEVLAQVADAVSTIVDGIETGVFVPHPKPHDTSPFTDCHACDPDGLGTTEAVRQWERKQADPILARYLALVAPLTQQLPPDQAARDAIGQDLGRTLFVEAGAGSGKSTALVERVLQLILSGVAEIRAIAAITFTEKAAAELRDKIRQALERAADTARSDGDPTAARHCEVAIDQLDGAAIGTLHSFAQRILAEHPIEVQLPPRVEIVDEVSSDVAFEQRWSTELDRMLGDPDLKRTLLLLFATGVKPVALRSLALEFDRNWDLVEDRVPADAPDPPPLRSSLSAALTAVDEVVAQAAHCSNPDDKLVLRLGLIADHARALRAIDDEIDLLDELSGVGALAPPSFKVGNVGAKGNWDLDVATLRSQVRAAGDQLDAVGGAVAQACAHRVAASLRRFTLDAAQARRDAGQLAFHDLLVLARLLVSRHPEVRERLHHRYQRLLLDEFQDTDPIQIEIAVRIAAAEPSSVEAGTQRWDEVDVAPGHLFFVGDPKQSIYRFRRADIALFLDAADRYGTDDGGVTLTTNFRTGAPIISWVNTAFARLMAEGADVDLPVASQPRYVPLEPWRPGPPAGPAVSVIGRAPVPDASAPELRAAEASDVADTITRIRAEGWSVRDDTVDPPWRPANLGDITVLVPARTSLPFLEDALDQGGIAYRAESSSLVYVSRAVRDLLMVLRAIDDPSDHLAVVAALRTPLFGCGDDDLFVHKVIERGHWNHAVGQPQTVSTGPVLDALSYLGELHRQRHWSSPAELADRVARDRRLFELGFAEGRTRDVWRRLRFVIDQAREWGEATDGTLRQYLHWVQRQSAEGARVAEAVLPESDDDAVRIMTIHAAKGLEFPITIVSGMSTVPQARPSPAQVVFPPEGGVGYRFGRYVTTQVFEDWVPVDEQMAYDERIRLLYVACTRAQDHLVLSLQRKARAKAPEPSKRTNAELLLDGTGEELLAQLPDAVEGAGALPPVTTLAPPERPAPFDRWQSERAAALAAGSHPTTVAATAITADGDPDVARDEPERDPEVAQPAVAGLEKRPRDLDLPPWLKGRYGTAVGRAVHATLQSIDLSDPTDLTAVVAAQCEAEAIPGRADVVEGLVREALGAPVVARAAQGPHWREIYACTPVGADGRLLEGYIDLLYRSDEGMVIVDYKTAATTEAAELDRRVAGYRLQGGAYALAVGQTTGAPVARVVFVFLTPAGAIERDLHDVPAAVAEVNALVTAADEQVTA